MRHLFAGALFGSTVLACSMGGREESGSSAKILLPPSCPIEQQRCAVDFTYPPPGVAPAEAAVEIRGSWADGKWTAGEPMTNYGSQWKRTLLLPPGATAEYKYCVDPAPNGDCNRWDSDPTKPTTGPDGNNTLGPVACDQPVCASTAASARVRFIAVGDTGYEGINSVATAMGEKCQRDGCDFVLMLGDNVYPDGASSPDDPALQAAFADHFSPVHAPFKVALGNHDYGGDGAGTEYARAQNEIDYTERSKKWRMPDRYYRFSAGDVDFFALDTNAQMYSLDDQQKVDVGAWIAASHARWKIAFGHHPYLSNGPHGNAGTYDGQAGVPVWSGDEVKAFADQVYCGKVDLYLSGHDHTRQWMTGTCNGTHLVVSGAGATSTELPGTGPTEFQSLDLGFLYAVIDGDTLIAQFIDGAGNVNFQRTITAAAR